MIAKLDTLALKVLHEVPLKIGELKEWARRKKQEILGYKSAHKKKEFPILHSVEDTESMSGNGKQRYLRYCLSLIRKEHPQAHDLLILLLNGWSHARIAKAMNDQGFNVTVHEVKRREGEALKFVTDTITRLKEKGIPIFSDIPAHEGITA